MLKKLFIWQGYVSFQHISFTYLNYKKLTFKIIDKATGKPFYIKSKNNQLVVGKWNIDLPKLESSTLPWNIVIYGRTYILGDSFMLL